MNYKGIFDETTKSIKEHGGYGEVHQILLEQRVYLYIHFSLDKPYESIESNHIIGGFLPDIYLPRGCRRLGFPAQTAIEIKERLIHNTLSKILQYADSNANYLNQLVLIYKDKGNVSEEVLEDVKCNNKVKVLSVEEFDLQFNRKSSLYDTPTVKSQWKRQREQIINKARESFHNNRVSFFLGAGVSQSAGGPSWNELLTKVLAEFRRKTKFSDLDITKLYKSVNSSSIILGRYAFPQTQDSLNRLSEYLRSEVLYNKIGRSELVEQIVKACIENNNIESIITYNYDDVIEREFDWQCDNKIEKIYETIFEKNRALNRQIPIYHVHGFIPREKITGYQPKPILSEADYHSIYREAYHWSNVEQLHALDRNTCFFIGLSMTDPNLRRLLDISKTNSEETPEHYVFIQRNKILFNEDRELKNQYNYEIIEQMMQDIGARIIWYKSHKEIPVLLNAIIS